MVLSGPLKRLASVYISREHGRLDILYEACAGISHTNLQLHVHSIIETLHDQSFSLTSEECLKPATSYWVPEGQEL